MKHITPLLLLVLVGCGTVNSDVLYVRQGVFMTSTAHTADDDRGPFLTRSALRATNIQKASDFCHGTIRVIEHKESVTPFSVREQLTFKCATGE